MADAMRTLPDAELEVMQAIWACEEPVKRAAISAILDRTHPMAPTTLLTVLSRLAALCRSKRPGAAPNTGRWSQKRTILPGRGGNSTISSAAEACRPLPPRSAPAG